MGHDWLRLDKRRPPYYKRPSVSGAEKISQRKKVHTASSLFQHIEFAYPAAMAPIAATTEEPSRRRVSAQIALIFTWPI